MKTIDRGTMPGVVITNTDLLASLRLSPEARARIDELERSRAWPPPIILD